LNGTVPDEISILSSLEILDLGNNNDLIGTIPSAIGGLLDLTELRLTSSSFTGSIPEDIGNMTSLETISIDINDLTGSIPTSIGGLSRLRNWNGSFNKLTGTMPSEIGLMTDLRIFFTQHNEIAGSMPSTMASLTSLRQVDVSYNRLVDGAENLCEISTLVVYQSDCFKQLIPAIDREICCPCCSLCCNDFFGGCQANSEQDC
jgi:Leucine-rich repeat (LRR) protein